MFHQPLERSEVYKEPHTFAFLAVFTDVAPGLYVPGKVLPHVNCTGIYLVLKCRIFCIETYKTLSFTRKINNLMSNWIVTKSEQVTWGRFDLHFTHLSSYIIIYAKVLQPFLKRRFTANLRKKKYVKVVSDRINVCWMADIAVIDDANTWMITELSSQLSGSWSRCEFVIYP